MKNPPPEINPDTQDDYNPEWDKFAIRVVLVAFATAAVLLGLFCYLFVQS